MSSATVRDVNGDTLVVTDMVRFHHAGRWRLGWVTRVVDVDRIRVQYAQSTGRMVATHVNPAACELSKQMKLFDDRSRRGRSR